MRKEKSQKAKKQMKVAQENLKMLCQQIRHINTIKLNKIKTIQ